MSRVQNVIIKGRGNPVSILFSFTDDFKTDGLNNFTRISIQVGDETYDTDSNNVTIISNNELRFRIGTVTSLEKGYYDLTVTGYSPTYANGYELISPDVSTMDQIQVV